MIVAWDEIRKLVADIKANPGSANEWARGRRAENKVIRKMRLINKLLEAPGPTNFDAIVVATDEAFVLLHGHRVRGGYNERRATYVERRLITIRVACREYRIFRTHSEVRLIISGLGTSSLGALAG